MSFDDQTPEELAEMERRLKEMRNDRRRDHGPLKEHKTGLEDLGIATTCPLIDMYLDQLEGEVGDGVSSEALELLEEYLGIFEVKIAAIRLKATTPVLDLDDELRRMVDGGES